MYKTKSVGQVKSSTLKAFEASEKITLEHIRNISKLRRILGRVLRIFAPLM